MLPDFTPSLRWLLLLGLLAAGPVLAQDDGIPTAVPAAPAATAEPVDTEAAGEDASPGTEEKKDDEIKVREMLATTFPEQHKLMQLARKRQELEPRKLALELRSAELNVQDPTAAIQVNAQLAHVRKQLAGVNEECQKRGKTILKEFDKVEKIAPDNPAVIYGKCSIYSLMQDKEQTRIYLDKALALFRSGLDKEAPSPDSLKLIVGLLTKNEDWTNSVMLIEETEARYPSDPKLQPIYAQLRDAVQKLHDAVAKAQLEYDTRMEKARQQ